MPADLEPSGPTLAVFAAASLPSDEGHTRLLSGAGGFLAGKGVRLVCLVEQGVYPRPLVTAARSKGGEVILLSDGSLNPGALASGCTLETIEDEEARHQRMADLSDAILGLPAGLAAVRALFGVWEMAGAGAGGKPVGLLNRNRAYEVLRGFVVDVVTHSLAKSDRMIVFADTIEEVWSGLERSLSK